MIIRFLLHKDLRKAALIDISALIKAEILKPAFLRLSSEAAGVGEAVAPADAEAVETAAESMAASAAKAAAAKAAAAAAATAAAAAADDDDDAANEVNFGIT